MNAYALRTDWQDPITDRGSWGGRTTCSSSDSFLSGREKFLIVSVDRLSKKVAKILGSSGVQRFEEFKMYHSGWDHGYGKSLSYKSVAVMESFLSMLSILDTEPSIFFTREGNLQLGWEDKEGKVIELEFFPDRIEYYLEGRSLESEVPVDASGSCFNKLIKELTDL